ncbi:hypothetical protein HMI01_11030 [Halolactibacillus miurensis]|uniref:Uncharacterized protein n=1 Tax=Halolactibacillus miurensis TaxID=306541 RepID=A0A1I6SH21_9BACI|nr:hypothetical protein [Halolactibacillus miurensis]GEM04115.1 hypothetical protein HMI01_11030 [Halolactibacillus miurensis]SFS76160.1 hypothetical protein SAMN05421668_10940 [Halolactibacillus miurensis]
MKQRKWILLTMVLLTMLLSACSSAADTVSHNISKDSDEFRVIRRVVFYNSLTDTYIMEMVGNISVDLDRDNVIEVIAKVGPDKYQKHYLGLSDNVTYTVEQLRTSDVSEYDYKMIFKPEKIIPIDFEYKKGEEPMTGVVTE